MDQAIIRTAHELTLKFQSGSDIPSRFTENKTTSIKKSLDSRVEKRYQKHIHAWTNTIHSILNHVPDRAQAWRFIRIDPIVEDATVNSVIHCKDFIDFHNLLVKRRDIDNCGSDELGKLCMLMTACQREIEKTLSQES